MSWCIRTTLTIDDDVTAMLEQLRKTRSASLKDLINEALRRGLRDMATRPKPRSPFRTRSVDLGRVRIASIAWDQVTAWLGCGCAWIPEPTERHVEALGELITFAGVHANLVLGVHLAALAIEHGLILCSTDGDFARFPGLRWLNPLTMQPDWPAN